MAKYTDFDKRMKRYEAASDICLTKRMPVVLRFDGSHFHTFTRGFKKPFDDILIRTMQQTMMDLCKEIQGAVFGYTQSDEITIVLADYQTLKTDAWFDYRLEKLCSIGASKAARLFNKHYIENVEAAFNESNAEMSDSEKAVYEVYKKKYFSADFDCRAYNVPKEDVCNCLLWRQRDAIKNSVQSLAQSLYSAKELHGLSREELKRKMLEEKDVDWSNLPNHYQSGTSCYQNEQKAWSMDTKLVISADTRETVEKHFIF